MLRINWVNHSWSNFEGYPRYGQYMVRALTKEGVRVTPILRDNLNMPVDLQQMLGVDYTVPTISLMPGFLLKPLPGRQWVYTMVESDGVPEGWIEAINQHAERLLVPCQHNKTVFEQRGVTIPVHVIPGGTSPDDFPLVSPPAEPRPFTFMAIAEAARGVRKGFEQVYNAFYAAFGGDPARYPDGVKDVRLIIKTRTPDQNFLRVIENHDSRITVCRGDAQSMAAVYAKADCFVFPSRGEGFGMPPREAAMSGIPTIATNWSGLADGLECWGIPLHDFTLVPVPYESLLTRDARWAFVNVKELSATMRRVYDQPLAAKASALRAAQWLRDHQTWQHSARALIELLETYP